MSHLNIPQATLRLDGQEIAIALYAGYDFKSSTAKPSPKHWMVTINFYVDRNHLDLLTTALGGTKKDWELWVLSIDKNQAFVSFDEEIEEPIRNPRNYLRARVRKLQLCLPEAREYLISMQEAIEYRDSIQG